MLKFGKFKVDTFHAVAVASCVFLLFVLEGKRDDLLAALLLCSLLLLADSLYMYFEDLKKDDDDDFAI